MISSATNNLRLLATNVPSDDIRVVVAQAKVILIGERHLLASDRANIAQVVNCFDNVQLLLEGDYTHIVPSVFPEIKNRDFLAKAKSWDSDEALKPFFQLMGDEYFPKIIEGRKLLEVFLKWLDGEDLTDSGEFLRNYAPHAEINEVFRAAANSWLERFEKVLKARDQMIRTTFAVRNLKLFETAAEEEKTAKKVILIGGSSHFASNTHHYAVAQLFKSLSEASFTYAVLDQKDTHSSEPPSQFRVYQISKKHVLEFRGKIYPKSMTREFVEELKATYRSGKPFNTSQLEYDTGKMACLLLGVAYMSKGNPVEMA